MSQSASRSTSAAFSAPSAAASGLTKGASFASNQSLGSLKEGQSELDSIIKAMEELRKADAGGDQGEFLVGIKGVLGEDFAALVEHTHNIAHALAHKGLTAMSSAVLGACQLAFDLSLATHFATIGGGSISAGLRTGGENLSKNLEKFAGEFNANLNKINLNIEQKGFGGHNSIISALASVSHALTNAPSASVASGVDLTDSATKAVKAAAIAGTAAGKATGEAATSAGKAAGKAATSAGKAAGEAAKATLIALTKRLKLEWKASVGAPQEISDLASLITKTYDGEGNNPTIETLQKINKNINEVGNKLKHSKSNTAETVVSATASGVGAILTSMKSIVLQSAALSILSEAATENQAAKDFAVNSFTKASSLPKKGNHSQNLSRSHDASMGFRKGAGEKVKGKDLDGSGASYIESMGIVSQMLSEIAVSIPVTALDVVGAGSREVSAIAKHTTGDPLSVTNQAMSDLICYLKELGARLDALQDAASGTAEAKEVASAQGVLAPIASAVARSAVSGGATSATSILAGFASSLSEFTKLSTGPLFKQNMKRVRLEAKEKARGEGRELAKSQVEITNKSIGFAAGATASALGSEEGAGESLDLDAEQKGSSERFSNLQSAMDNLFGAILVSDSQTLEGKAGRAHLGKIGVKSDASGRSFFHATSVNAPGTTMSMAGLLSIIAIETGISAETMIELVSKSGTAISECLNNTNFNEVLTKLIHSDHVFATAERLEGIAKGVEVKDSCVDDCVSFSHSTANTISGVSRVLEFISKLIPRAVDISLSKSIFVASSEAGVISEALKKLTDEELKELNQLEVGDGAVVDGAGAEAEGAAEGGAAEGGAEGGAAEGGAGAAEGGAEGGAGAAVMAAPAGSLARGDQSTRALAGNAVISKLSDEIFKVLNVDADQAGELEIQVADGAAELEIPLIPGDRNGRATSQSKDNAVQRNEVIAGEIASILQSSICSAVITNISALQSLIKAELSARQSAKDSGKGSQAQENLVARLVSEKISRALNGLELASKQQASAPGERHEDGEAGTLRETMGAAASLTGAATQSLAATGVVSVEASGTLVSRSLTLINRQESKEELGRVSDGISEIISKEFKKAFDEISADSKVREGEAGTSNSLNNGATNATLAMRITLSRFGQSLFQAGSEAGKSAGDESESKLHDGKLHTAQRAMLKSLGKMLIELSKSGSFCSAFSGAVLSLPMILPGLLDDAIESSGHKARSTRAGIGQSSRCDGSAAKSTVKSSQGGGDGCKSSDEATRLVTGIPIDGVTSAADTILRNIILSIFNMARTGTLTASGVTHLVSTIVSAPNPSGETGRDIDVTQGLAPEASLLYASSRSKEERIMELSIISAALTAGLVQPSHELIGHINESIETLTVQSNDVLNLLLPEQSESLRIPETIKLHSLVHCLLKSTLQEFMRGVNLLRDSEDSSDDPSDDPSDSKIKVRGYIKILIGIMNPELADKNVILDNLARIYNKGGRKIGTISHKGQDRKEIVTLDTFTKDILEAISVDGSVDDYVPMAEPVTMEGWVKSHNVKLAVPVEAPPAAAVDAVDDIHITKCLNVSQTAADLRDNFIDKVYKEFVAEGTSDSLGALRGKDLSDDASSLHGYILREVSSKINHELLMTKTTQPFSQGQGDDGEKLKKLGIAKQALDNLIAGRTGLGDVGVAAVYVQQGGAGEMRSSSPSAPRLPFKEDSSGEKREKVGAYDSDDFDGV